MRGNRNRRGFTRSTQPSIHDYDDLGRYYIEELDVMQVPEHLQNYIDYEAYGRDVALEENGTFTDQGYNHFKSISKRILSKTKPSDSKLLL
jgi:hypothetical protein